jgi:hypothetical protein
VQSKFKANSPPPPTSKRSLPSAALFPGPAGINTKPLGLREKSSVKAETAVKSKSANGAVFLLIIPHY